ncbi:hypothetical protein ACPPVO_34910 [Dactylosporangium sp. McL0621]|uniref:hypothetical protein n=1 Tax=Dactylosporangium sp. McL0621 TaxID=3415678 RepID=UPI003CF6691F
MPDFDQFAQHLHADVSRLDWPDPDRIRAVGSRRRRAQVAAMTLAVAVVVAGVLVLPRTGTRHAPAPAASLTPTATSPAPNPSTSAAPSLGAAVIPPSALLSATDFGGGFTASGGVFAAPAVPNPFIGCGPDGLPGDDQPVAGMGAGAGQQQNGSQGSDSVLRFAGGGAHRAMVAIDALVAGSCAGHYQVVDRTLGGDESLLLHSTDLSVVQPQAAHGREIYYAVVRKGDYLVWIALINPSQASGQTARATTLAHRALQRLCAAVAC